MPTKFSLFAEIEWDLISMRTKEGLAATKASGKKLGRPKGVLGKSKLDGREDEIRRLLALDVSKASIAKITGCNRSTLYNFISKFALVAEDGPVSIDEKSGTVKLKTVRKSK